MNLILAFCTQFVPAQNSVIALFSSLFNRSQLENLYPKRLIQSSQS